MRRISLVEVTATGKEETLTISAFTETLQKYKARISIEKVSVCGDDEIEIWKMRGKTCRREGHFVLTYSVTMY